jgi:FkbM family methyltransferase
MATDAPIPINMVRWYREIDMRFRTSSALLMNRIALSVPRPWRRFVLDRAIPARVRDRLAGKRVEWMPVGSTGRKLALNPLLHGELLRNNGLDYEPEVLNALRRLLPKNGVFWDVGANVGLFSVLLAAERGHVLAIEPEANNLHPLRQTCDRNPDLGIDVLAAAIGAQPGMALFDRRGGAFSGRLSDEGRAVADGVKVEVTTLDDLLRRGHRPPDLIKIDVEGGEGAVIAGAAELLDRVRPALLVELHWGHGPGAEEAVRRLTEQRYAFKALDDQQIDLQSPSVRPRFVIAYPQS